MVEQAVLWNATKDKLTAQYSVVRDMGVRSKRTVFCILRNHPDVDVDTFLPEHGLHCGEFCVYQILTGHSRRDGKDAKR